MLYFSKKEYVLCIIVIEGIVKPAQVMDCVELVVEDDHLVEQKRLPGENNVSKI